VTRAEPFSWGLFVTATLHAGATAAIVLGHARRAPLPPAPQVMVARLVRLGRPRAPDLLPRKAAAPPLPAVAPPVVPPEPHPPPQKPEAPQAKPSDVRGAMARARALAAKVEDKAEEPEGRPEGVAEGTADQASEGDPYATEVWRRIHDLWNVSHVVSARELPRLRAVVFLRLADDGRIVDHRIVESSGNRFFDASALDAVERVDRLPPPPRDRARAILEAGISLEFRGTEAK
jgi:periplasmic protein TonB